MYEQAYARHDEQHQLRKVVGDKREPDSRVAERQPIHEVSSDCFATQKYHQRERKRQRKRAASDQAAKGV